jgi:nucleotide-binding universal stress UspA family protein
MVNTLEELEKESKRHDLRIKTIVVAVDLSPHSEKTAAYAASIARCFGASVTFVHVTAPEPISEFATSESYEAFEEERRAKERALAVLLEKIRETCPSCYWELRIGDPAEEVTRLAQSLNADLVITASRHPDFLSRLFGFNLAPRLLHRLNCPLLIYYEPNT